MDLKIENARASVAAPMYADESTSDERSVS